MRREKLADANTDTTTSPISPKSWRLGEINYLVGPGHLRSIWGLDGRANTFSRTES